MKATQLLSNLCQNPGLDSITRELLNSDTLKHYITELSITGLTSNPTIFDTTIKNRAATRRSAGSWRRAASAQGTPEAIRPRA
jgi:transaldolase